MALTAAAAPIWVIVGQSTDKFTMEPVTQTMEVVGDQIAHGFNFVIQNLIGIFSSMDSFSLDDYSEYIDVNATRAWAEYEPLQATADSIGMRPDKVRDHS